MLCPICHVWNIADILKRFLFQFKYGNSHFYSSHDRQHYIQYRSLLYRSYLELYNEIARRGQYDYLQQLEYPDHSCQISRVPYIVHLDRRNFQPPRISAKHSSILKRKVSPDSAQGGLSSQGCAQKIWEQGLTLLTKRKKWFCMRDVSWGEAL